MLFNGIQKFELYLAPVNFIIRTDCRNFQYFLNAKIDKQIARGRLLSWQTWFQQYDFEIQWIPGNSNWLADVLTREMNKMFKVRLTDPNISYFHIRGNKAQDDDRQTIIARFNRLSELAPQVAEEIKKLVGLRLRRNDWIQKIRANKTKSLSTSLGMKEKLCKIYPGEGLKLKGNDLS